MGHCAGVGIRAGHHRLLRPGRPGLTEGVDEEALTCTALWEAVTGTPGTQTWHETVRVTCRNEAAEAARKAENERTHGPWRERAGKTLTEPATGKQISYLNKLVAQVARTLRQAADRGGGPQAGHRPGRPLPPIAGQALSGAVAVSRRGRNGLAVRLPADRPRGHVDGHSGRPVNASTGPRAHTGPSPCRSPARGRSSPGHRAPAHGEDAPQVIEVTVGAGVDTPG